MVKNPKLFIFAIFLIYLQPLFGNLKVEIEPIARIKAKLITDCEINFHIKKITISFCKDQIIEILDSINKFDIIKTNIDENKLYLSLKSRLISADCIDIFYDNDEEINSTSLESKLDTMEILLLHELCTELLDAGFYQIKNDGVIQKEIIKANVYESDRYSCTTYIKYYLLKKKYFWTGPSKIHDDYDIE